jgi:hypothetical protein
MCVIPADIFRVYQIYWMIQSKTFCRYISARVCVFCVLVCVCVCVCVCMCVCVCVCVCVWNSRMHACMARRIRVRVFRCGWVRVHTHTHTHTLAVPLLLCLTLYQDIITLPVYNYCTSILLHENYHELVVSVGWGRCECVCVCVCARARARSCVRACVTCAADSVDRSLN